MTDTRSSPGSAYEQGQSGQFTPGPPVEVRKVGDEIDEICIRAGDVHIEQMDDSSWFMGINACDGSYWQFWFGAKNRKSHVNFRHTETMPASENAAPQPSGAAQAGKEPDEQLWGRFANHYWDSFEGDKEIVLKHVKAVLDYHAENAAPPSPVAGEATAVTERLEKITTWLREPDWVEEASLEWLMNWMDRRPIAELAMVAMLMPGPVVSSTHQSAPAQSAVHNSGSPGSEASGDAGAGTMSPAHRNTPAE